MPLRVLALVAILSLSPVGAQQQPRGWTPDLVLKVKRVPAVVPSPDGDRVAYLVSEAVTEGDKSEFLGQIHVAAADGSGTFQLTRGEKSASAPRWSPDGQWMAFTTARGTARPALFRIRVSGGEAEQLTTEKEAIRAFEWAPDGRSIAFTMTEPKSEADEKAEKEKRDARVIDANDRLASVYVIPVDKNADGRRPSKRLTTGVHVTAFDWAPDGKTLVFSHQRTSKVFDPNDISVVSAGGGERKALAATAAHESEPLFSHDGRSVAYVTSDEPVTWAFTGWLRVIPAGGGAPKALAKTFDERPDLLGWSPDNRSVYVVETHGTIARLSAVPVDGGAPAVVSATDVNIGSPALNRTATAIGFAQSWPTRAPEPHVARLQPFAVKQVATVQQLPAPAVAPLGKTDVLTWKSTDGTPVEGLLTYPARYERGRAVPLLVIVHGGPTGVFTQAFVGMPGPYPIAVFSARGYAVLRVNPRGSSGYGRTFRYANYQDWGGGDYQDIMSGVDHVIGIGVADKDRLGIMGWSYGGYMTSWTITQTKRFKAASVGAGVTNLMSFTGTADIPGFIPDYFGGEYWDAFDRWRARSAMFHIKGVTTPTLIQHGEQDLRVPVSQGYELYNALVRQKVTTKMVVYPREPHGLQEPKHIHDAMEWNLRWFDQYVRGIAPPASTNAGGS